MTSSAVTIPNRPVFRAQEVCDLTGLQPFVLRTWEAEFPELGVAKSPTSPRVYRRADVERVLRIKHLLFVEGLTLAGARKRLAEEGFGVVADDAAPVADADVAAMIDHETRQQLRDVRRGLLWILGVLSGEGVSPADYVLTAAPAVPARSASKPRSVGHVTVASRAAKPLRPAKSKAFVRPGKKKR
jgi:DNA-binding transcriptional MerR regulator